MPAQRKVTVGGVSDAQAAKSYVTSVKSDRAALNALASGSGNLTNAELTVAVRRLAAVVNKMSRVISLITDPQTDDF